MADMNAWNKLQQSRGAVEALEDLRATIRGWLHVDKEEAELHRDVLKTIDQHIAKYRN